jgi:hypothetical protein
MSKKVTKTREFASDLRIQEVRKNAAKPSISILLLDSLYACGSKRKWEEDKNRRKIAKHTRRRNVDN